MMISAKKQLSVLAVLFIFILVLLTVGIHMALRGNALGFDYVTYWNAGRALFLEGLNPYSPDSARSLQISMYGRPALPGEYQFQFFYPLPILFVPLPLYLLGYAWSQAAWMALNLLIPISVVILMFPRAPKWLTLTIPLFYQMTFTVIIGNYAMLLGTALLIIFYSLFFAGREIGWLDFLGGFALAWMINKPQMVWLYCLLILLAALKLRRKKLFYGFAAGLGLLYGVSFLLLPDWPVQWLNNVRLYPQASVQAGAHGSSIAAYLGYLLPQPAVQAAAAVLGMLLAVFTGWMLVRWWQGKLDSLRMIAICGFVIYLVDVSALTPDQLVLLVPFFLWALLSKPSNALKIVWLATIALSYALFALAQSGIIPGAADRGPLLLYILWLASLWLPLPALRKSNPLKVQC